VEDVDELRRGLNRMQRMLGSRRIQSRLAEVAGVEISQQAMQVLRVLVDGERFAVADVARRARMDVGAVSRQLRALEADGFVEREASPDHGSVVLVHATPSGAKVRDHLEAVQRRQFDEALAGWTPEDRAVLGRLLTRLVEDLQRTPYRAG
jgi:DNA-binding MarR family transcriptional regulator